MDSRKCFGLASLVIVLSLSIIEFLPILSDKQSEFHGFRLRERRYGGLQATTREPEHNNPFKWWDYLIVGAMICVSAGTGLYHAFAGEGQRTTSRFLMAERSMFSLPVAISVLASYLSAITVLGFPSEIFFHGIQYWMVAWSFFLVIPVTALVFIPVFHGLGLTSAYEYLRKRFSPAVQYAGSVLFIIQTVFYVAIVLYAPAVALKEVTTIPLWATIVVMGLLCTAYTALGGIKAVIWTDVFQFLVLFGSLLVVLVLGTKEAGGPSKVWKYNQKNHHLNFFVFDPDPTERLSFWSLVIGGAFNALPIWAVSQTAVQRFLTASTLKEAQRSVWYNLPGNIVMMTIVSLIGLVLYSHFQGVTPSDMKPDQILIHFVNEEIPQIQGLFIACLFAGTLSTVASGLNSLAAVTLIDIVKTLRQRGQYLRLPLLDEETITEEAARQDYRDTVLSKVLTLVYGVITVLAAFLAQYMGTLVQMANTVFGSIGGPLLGVFSLGVLYKRGNSGGAIIGLIAGAYMGFWISIGAIIHTDENGVIDPNAFWLYRISFMWYSTVSSLTTFILGVISSEIIRRCIPDERYREVDPLLLATFLRPRGWHRCVSATESHDPSVVIGTRVIPNLYREIDANETEDEALLSVDEEDAVQMQPSSDHNFESHN